MSFFIVCQDHRVKLLLWIGLIPSLMEYRAKFKERWKVKQALLYRQLRPDNDSYQTAEVLFIKLGFP